MTLDEAKAILANPDSTSAQKKQAEIFIQQSGTISQAPTPVKNTGINLDLSNKDHDIWARQMGAENWLDAIEKYKENPKWFTDNKYKVQGDERYTPEMIINRLESELSTQPGAKSAGGERSSITTPISTLNSESEPISRELTFDELAAQLGLDPNNPTKEGQEKLRSWIEEHADNYTSGEKTNAYLNAELQEANKLAEPEKGDTKKEENAKNQYKKSAMSIWDAYHNGLISKETAAYFTIDAIATLAKNLGRSLGNVGAQFSVEQLTLVMMNLCGTREKERCSKKKHNWRKKALVDQLEEKQHQKSKVLLLSNLQMLVHLFRMNIQESSLNKKLQQWRNNSRWLTLISIMQKVRKLLLMKSRKIRIGLLIHSKLLLFLC